MTMGRAVDHFFDLGIGTEKSIASHRAALICEV